MDKSKWIWMGRPAHFVWWRQCQFRLATYVGGYIVSTIGEWTSKENDFIKLDYDRLYETKVFKAIKSKHECYPYVIIGEELDFAGYNTAKEAYKGHLKMCKKWAKKSEVKSKRKQK